MSSLKIVLVAGVAGLALVSCSSSKSGGGGSTSTGAGAVVQTSSSSPPPVTTTSAAPVTSAAAGSLTGKWTGTYSGAYTGTFTLNWTQTGSQLAGTIDLSSTGMSNLNGSVSGGHITFGTVGSTVITYTGSVSGNSMSGSYQIAGGAGGTGSWSAHRS